MSGQEPSRPKKGKTVKKARKAKYIIRVPSTIPFANASTPLDVGSSRPSPPSMVPTASVGPTPPTIGPTPSILGPTPPIVVPTPSVVGPTPYIHPSPISTPSFIPSPDVHQPSVDPAHPADPTDLGDHAPHDRPFIEPYGRGTTPLLGGEHIWNSLLAHWNTPQYRIKCATAQKNRALEKGGVLHTGGSITTHEHVILIATELGRAVHVDDVVTQTPIRKGTGEYVDERSCKTIVDFSARLTQARSEGGSGPDGNFRVDADEEFFRTQCCVYVVGGKKKGQLYGVGQLASHYSVGRGGIFRHQSFTSSTFDPNNVVSKDSYDSLLARFDNLKNLVRTLVPQQGHTAPSSSQQPCPPQ